ncbi:head-tail connector protein [Macrococcus psychrotolerans]|uniref:Head-tail connector protein n=1 Tax=Macrococcus psychrotolerans TaxID=3039389 RepID=A0AAU6REA9_9STAP
MILTIEEARSILRVDDDYNDEIIKPLLQAIPEYLYLTTGRRWDYGEPVPLAKTTAGFILQLWFDPQTKDSERLKRTIESLIVSLTALGRSYND